MDDTPNYQVGARWSFFSFAGNDSAGYLGVQSVHFGEHLLLSDWDGTLLHKGCDTGYASWISTTLIKRLPWL
jgi:hypothetical protein